MGPKTTNIKLHNFEIDKKLITANTFDGAGILAAAVDARFIGGAVRVLPTADGAHAVEANVAEETVIVHSAGQHAIAGHALLVDGALGIDGAERDATAFGTAVAVLAVAVAAASDWDSDAFGFGRSGESSGTRADGLVIFRPALGVHTAETVDGARIDALAPDASLGILTLDAGLAGRLANSAVAERVGRTIGLGFTGDRFADAADRLFGGVAFESLATNASRFVVGRPAIGVGPARISSANILTFRLAPFSTANGRLRAILILATLHRLLASFSVRLANSSSRAETFVRASGVLASSAGGARCLRTVIDGRTAGHDVAGVARLAFADGLVFLREAERVLAALVVHHTGDLAPVLVAALVAGTILVFGAFDLEAADLVVLRVAEESFFTGADGLAVDDFASGVATAQNGAVARVAAFRLSVAGFQTALPVSAFLVGAAAHFLDADAVGADLAVDALGIVGTSRATFAFDTLLGR